MPTLILTTPGARASLVSDRLRVELPATEESLAVARDVHLHDVEQIILSECAHLSIPALTECVRQSIPIYLVTNSDRVVGVCHPPGAYSRARLSQYDRCRDPFFALSIAAALVEAKILNSRRVLQRLAANREHIEITPVLLSLKHLAESAISAKCLETLRGLEGTAAGRYFETYNLFFPEESPFERRSRRPPHNPPNAILSYCYTILAAEAETALYTCGLDPCLGFYHETEDRPASLALDIIEPFRAPVADAMALDLLTHGTLHPVRHFDKRDGGVYLNTDGRKRFYVAYERRMERPYTSEQSGVRTTIRNELHLQAQKLKRTILEGEVYEPFLMN
jgi:CRISPR-associated protein Cas1